MKEYKTKAQQKKFYNSSTWKHLRRNRLQIDNWECQPCKREGRVHLDSVKEEGKHKSIELNVHHKEEIEYRPDLALSLDNLETVCLYHHNKIHGRFKKKINWWQTDERW